MVLWGSVAVLVVGAVVSTIFGSLPVAAFFVLGSGWGVWFTWPVCFRASIDGRTLYYTQLTGTRSGRLADIVKITRHRYGEGGGTLYRVHFVDGARAAFDGDRGRDFIEALMRASPSINPPKGWRS